jgi:hypothetical protein
VGQRNSLWRASASPKREKKLKASMKRLRQIEELKTKDKASLDSDQLSKLEGEEQLREQILQLEKIVN